jgi:peptidoglycan/LPS O-acetylase OafA/YrhL
MKISSTEKKEKNNASKRIIGIEILRMYLCFRIVLLHYYSSKNKFINKIRRNHFQVPCFFFISFYFLYPTISTKNISKMKLRLERLLIDSIEF